MDTADFLFQLFQQLPNFVGSVIVFFPGKIKAASAALLSFTVFEMVSYFLLVSIKQRKRANLKRMNIAVPALTQLDTSPFESLEEQFLYRLELFVALTTHAVGSSCTGHLVEGECRISGADGIGWFLVLLHAAFFAAFLLVGLRILCVPHDPQEACEGTTDDRAYKSSRWQVYASGVGFTDRAIDMMDPSDPPRDRRVYFTPRIAP
jgi:hypothetical protein